MTSHRQHSAEQPSLVTAGEDLGVVPGEPEQKLVEDGVRLVEVAEDGAQVFVNADCHEGTVVAVGVPELHVKIVPSDDVTAAVREPLL